MQQNLNGKIDENYIDKLDIAGYNNNIKFAIALDNVKGGSSMEHDELYYEKLEWNCILEAMERDRAENSGEYDDDDMDEADLY